MKRPSLHGGSNDTPFGASSQTSRARDRGADRRVDRGRDGRRRDRGSRCACRRTQLPVVACLGTKQTTAVLAPQGRLHRSMSPLLPGSSSKVGATTVVGSSITATSAQIKRACKQVACCPGYYADGDSCKPYGGSCANGELAPQAQRTQPLFDGIEGLQFRSA